jgi:hypothetical protein
MSQSNLSLEPVKEVCLLPITKIDLQNKKYSTIDHINQYTSDYFILFWANSIISWMITEAEFNVDYVVSIPHTDEATRKNFKGDIELKSAIPMESIRVLLQKVFCNHLKMFRINSTNWVDNNMAFEFLVNSNKIPYFTIARVNKNNKSLNANIDTFPQTAKSPSKKIPKRNKIDIDLDKMNIQEIDNVMKKLSIKKQSLSNLEEQKVVEFEIDDKF